MLVHVNLYLLLPFRIYSFLLLQIAIMIYYHVAIFSDGPALGTELLQHAMVCLWLQHKIVWFENCVSRAGPSQRSKRLGRRGTLTENHLTDLVLYPE